MRRSKGRPLTKDNSYDNLCKYLVEIYGPRAGSLLDAFQKQTEHVALVNPFVSAAETADVPFEQVGGWGSCSVARYHPVNGVYPPPTTDSATALKAYYWLDFASLLPPLLLGAQPGETVLDMCAAPGGKSLFLAYQMFAESGTGLLVANEPDPQRRRRLQSVLDTSLAPRCSTCVRVTRHDASLYWACREASRFDAVLLDAPCTSDRHVAQQAAAAGRGAAWSRAACQAAADLQVKLLVAALRAVKVGGRVVYSTCSASPLQNDNVVERALARAGTGSALVLAPGHESYGHRYRPMGGLSGTLTGKRDFERVQADSLGAQHGASLWGEDILAVFGAELCRHGVICLPDRSGHGPMYVCVLRKVGPVAGAQPSVPRLGALRRVGSSSEGSSEGSGSEGGCEGRGNRSSSEGVHGASSAMGSEADGRGAAAAQQDDAVE